MTALLFGKCREALLSVIPIVVIVFVLSFTPLAEFEAGELTVFLICAIGLIIGIGLFNLGADISMTPMGEHTGNGLVKNGKISVLLNVALIFGVMITVAEPDLTVLAVQVSAVMNSTLLIFTVGAGVGLFLVFGVLKIVFHKPLSMLLMLFYMIIFALGALLLETGKGDFLPLSFDSGGVTTGPITVPFIMALGLGIAKGVGGHDANENSFGLVSLCSVGPMLAVMLLSLGSSGNLEYEMADYSMEAALNAGLMTLIWSKVKEVAIALGLIVVFFMIVQKLFLKLSKRHLARLFVGIAYTFAGLVIFLSSVSIGFIPIGFKIGTELSGASSYVPCIFAFVIGMVTVIAEPAVHVLNRQVDDVTNGSVSRKSMLVALSIGVGAAICLSVIRMLLGFSILFYLIPGYILSLGLSVFVPPIYTAIAFDSGGVASGPLTSSFILPMMIGICYSTVGEEGILSMAFGVVAMVAMTPLITIQLLGFKAIAKRKMQEKLVMNRIENADDEQIIYF